jgi:hypothetical protein
MQKILEGSLDRFESPDILTFLNLGHRAGVLVFERPEQETKLFFDDGDPVFANSTKLELRFGMLLERLGKVTSEQLARVGPRQRTGLRIGQILLQERILSEEELASFLKVQVSEVIFDTFSWHTGVFTFYDGVPPPSTAVTLDMGIQNLIMEGVRRQDERARISEVFTRKDLVIEVVANPERVKQNVTLTRDEWQVFFLIDGRRSLEEICRASGNPDELAIFQILYHLVVAKFAILKPPAQAPSTPLPQIEGSGDGTQFFSPGRGETGAKPSVAFSSPLPPVQRKDDTREIVNPKAMKYLDNARHVTVSRLILVRDEGETSFPLTRDSYTLGRHRNNDILVTDVKVSSFHARIDRSSEGFVLVDLKSRNGTFLNGRKIETGLLKTGDEIRLGTARLLYKVDFTSGA